MRNIQLKNWQADLVSPNFSAARVSECPISFTNIVYLNWTQHLIDSSLLGSESGQFITAAWQSATVRDGKQAWLHLFYLASFLNESCMQWKALLNSSFRHLSFIQAALNLPVFFYLFHTTCKTASLITSLKSIMIYFPMFLLRFTSRELKHLGKLRKSVSSICLRLLVSLAVIFLGSVPFSSSWCCWWDCDWSADLTSKCCNLIKVCCILGLGS